MKTFMPRMIGWFVLATSATLPLSGEDDWSRFDANNGSVAADGGSIVVAGNSAGSVSNLAQDGIQYEIHGPNRFEVKNGQVSVNGIDFGAVNAGDRVLLKENGQLLVNDEERKAQGSQAITEETILSPRIQPPLFSSDVANRF